MGRAVYIVSHCNSSKESEFSFVISSAEFWPMLVLVLCVRALCSLCFLLPLVIVSGREHRGVVGLPVPKIQGSTNSTGLVCSAAVEPG